MTTAPTSRARTTRDFAPSNDAFRENPAKSALRFAYTSTAIWGWHSDAARTRPWNRDAIANIWSTTQGIVATCAHRPPTTGRLDFDARSSGGI